MIADIMSNKTKHYTGFNVPVRSDTDTFAKRPTLYRVFGNDCTKVFAYYIGQNASCDIGHVAKL